MGKKAHVPVQLYPQLGLRYLASSLKEKGVEFELLDLPALGLSNERAVKRINKKSPEWVGIYVNSFNLPFAYELIRGLDEGIKTIIGGPHVTYCPRSVLSLGSTFGFAGEGEEAIPEIVTDLNLDIPGLIYKEGEDVKRNGVYVIKDLDSIPPPLREEASKTRYRTPLFHGKVTTMITSRGCPYNCIFCALPVRRPYRMHSIERVIREMEEIEGLGYEYVEIQDDMFTLNERRTRKLCEEMKKRRIGLKWGCETRADKVNYELLKAMKEAGCLNIKFGVESGSERVRNEVIGKGESNETIERTFRLCKELGIKTVAYFMFGHPSETLEEMRETLDFAKKLRPDYVEFHLSVPIPGSRLFEIAVEEGKLEEGAWDELVFGKEIPVYVPDGVSLREMEALRKEGYKSFYLNPKRILEELRDIKNFSSLRVKLRAFMSLMGVFS